MFVNTPSALASMVVAGLLTFHLRAGDTKMGMILQSPQFENNGEIPSEFTCEGRDVSPPLKWGNLPQDTKSFVLIVDDPDAPDPKAPKMTWVHWVLYNIPASANGLGEAIRELPPGTLEGLNDWKRTGYGGPCPPIGRHRYFHKLYAVDRVLPDLKKPTKVELEKAILSHTLGMATLVGTYQKKG